ncbi:SdrD B-like domain-containing protein [Jannaschia sp. LMIT008]|uniref:SdrD B-like domain-containing protein n=1 Tax=Jannaschia maritima TaxID=3032585 RepID=UPI002810E69E|nr:SdrD B-like domain-containing protein [Jannaschia sp. LMIT008]
MTKHYQSFTAFREADLTNKLTGSNIGVGDTFKLPGKPSVTLSVWDDDSKLNGDNHRSGRSDDWSQDAYIDGHKVGRDHDMYADRFHVLHDSDGNCYYMIEIEIEDHLAGGKSLDYFTFYGQVPPAGAHLTVAATYEVGSHGVSYAHLNGTPIPANSAPTFDNVPADGVIWVHENATLVRDLNSSDVDGDRPIYAITGGADADRFTIDQHTGKLSFRDAPDFENPTDEGHNNIYDVKVTVSDGKGGTTEKPLWIKVKDVDEGPVMICIEAEDMHRSNFKAVHGSQASGGELVKLKAGSGDLKTKFDGPDGTYDLTVHAQDESDGQSTIMVKVNGHVVGTIELDRDGDGRGSDNGGFSDFTLQDIALNKGDTLVLWAKKDGGEFVRIDKITLKEDDAPRDDCITIDFNDLDRGTVVNTQFDGLTVTADRNGSNARNDAMIFDTDDPTGGDDDLAFDGRGNVVIISEDNDSSDPDDAGQGGTITFDFDAPSDVVDLVLLDIEEAGGSIVLTFADGTSRTVDIPAAGNNSAQTIALNGADVVSLQVNLIGSGAVDDLCWVPGEVQPASVGGTYFMDANNNDVQDGGDMGVAGATVILLQDGQEVARTTTDGQGDYLFSNVAPGTGYTVSFQDPDDVAGSEGKTFVDADAGGDDTIDSDVTDLRADGSGWTDAFDLASGEDKRDVDGGIEDAGTASLAGKVFMDSNGNAFEDAGDMDVGGVTVRLLDDAGQVIGTTTTGADGTYEFTGLKADDYSVQFPTGVDGKVLVAKDVGGDDTVDSDADQGTGRTDTITLGVGQRSEDNDAGIVDPGDASISGRYFCDENGNDRDDAEPGIAGARVWLLAQQDGGGFQTVGNTITDGQGEYSFAGLDAGRYVVRFEDPDDVNGAAGKDFVAADVGDDLSDSDVTNVGGAGNGNTAPFDLAIGEAKTDVDAGIADPGTASLAGKVFMDNDGDALEGAGDMDVPGVTVTLLDEAGIVVATTQTGSDGSYEFTGLDAGTYSVRFPTEVDGKVLVAKDAGDDTIDSDADRGTGTTDPITLSVGQRSEDNDAGIEDPGTASLAGKVFMDNNDNATDDAGDMGIGGVTVSLLDAAGNTVRTAQTDSDGSYEFTGLAAGDYRVAFPTDVDGKTLAAQDVGDDRFDSDADRGTGLTDTISLAIGQRSEDNDAGVRDPGTASLAGKVFMDNDKDDLDGAGDMGIRGVEVQLLDSDGAIVATTRTDQDGAYEFTGLDAGSYAVRFPTEVAGKGLVAKDVGGDDTIDSDADRGTGTTDPITLAIGERSEDNDAGVADPGTAEVGDLVFLDANGNGVFDAGDTGVGGVTVQLLDQDGDVVDTAQTDGSGAYRFTGLDAGVYSVRFVAPDGLEFTTQSNVAADATNDDSDAASVDGETGQFTLSIGESEQDIDAGLVRTDTGDAAVGDTVFLDENRDGVRNAGEAGVQGVEVKLLDSDGGVLSTTTTDGNGKYRFDSLDAGRYAVMFGTAAGLGFTTQSAAAPDAANDDSDASTADATLGMTDFFDLSIGEEELDIDAGLVALNQDPDLTDDEAMGCADEEIVADVLDNDGDRDGDTLTITGVAGQAIAEGQTVQTSAGTNVKLENGKLVIDAEDAYIALDIGESVVEDISYTVSDGRNGTATANLELTVKGDANDYDSLIDSFPNFVQFEVMGALADPDAFTVRIDAPSDERFDGISIENAYCLDFYEPIPLNDQYRAAVTSAEGAEGRGVLNAAATDARYVSSFNGQTARDNLDLVNWIVAQDFEGTGAYSGWDVQFAIWELTSNVRTERQTGLYTEADPDQVDEILALAAANEGYANAGDGGIVSVIFDPDPQRDGELEQPFIVGIPFDDYDCLC